MALTKVLEKDGYEVVTHTTANAAIALINQTKKRFDLVITAFGDWGQYMEAMREGACDYLSKPVPKDELLACARRALSAHPVRQPVT